MSGIRTFIAGAVWFWPALAFAQLEINNPLGPGGVNSAGLTLPNGMPLDGIGVTVGHVEPIRPLSPNVPDIESNPNIVPQEVTRLAGQNAIPNVEIFANNNPHALWTAGIIVSKDATDSTFPTNSRSPLGLAPQAELYADAYLTGGHAGSIDALLSTQYIARRFRPFSNADHIRVINHSWLKPLGGLENLDGNSLLTKGMDWIASQHDVLNVFAFVDDGTPINLAPSDNYNGMTIAYSERSLDGWQKFGTTNDFFADAEGTRVSIDLLAPGKDLELAHTSGSELLDPTIFGSSFAAPHVTGAAALLSQFADHQIATVGGTHWDTDNPRRHEVLKAVLLNSADKEKGVHGSQKTAITDLVGGYEWDESPAFNSDTQSLDQKLGAGLLNTKRALIQFDNGEWGPNVGIPAIGWDHHETGGVGTTLQYPFEDAVPAGHVALTLAWDREITKTGSETIYSPFDVLIGEQLSDLNLYLAPVGWTNLAQDAVAKSVTTDDNVEHIFKNVAGGNYEIVVQHSGGRDVDVDFALAWWTGGDGLPTPGDYDGDGDVDADDFSGPNGWESRFGADLAGSDFLNWQRNFVGTAAPLAPPGGGSPASLGKGTSPGADTGGGTQSSFGQSIVISVEGDSPDSLMVGQTGQLTIMFDSDPADVTFANGGLSLSIETSESGFIEITDADVNNPQIFGGYVDRWTHAEVVGLTTDEIDDLFAFSLGSPALTDADPANMESDGRFLFATIDYTVVGEMPAGGFEIDVAASDRADPAVSDGADVLGQIVFIPLMLSGSSVAAVPEPGCLLSAAVLLFASFASIRRR